jgi:hypothetical protein
MHVTTASIPIDDANGDFVGSYAIDIKMDGVTAIASQVPSKYKGMNQTVITENGSGIYSSEYELHSDAVDSIFDFGYDASVLEQITSIGSTKEPISIAGKLAMVHQIEGTN